MLAQVVRSRTVSWSSASWTPSGMVRWVTAEDRQVSPDGNFGKVKNHGRDEDRRVHRPRSVLVRELVPMTARVTTLKGGQ